MVRKRKNSEETTATVPRLTRRRRNHDDDGDLESTVLEKSSRAPRTPKTPSTAKRSYRKRIFAANEDPSISTRSRRAPRLKSSSDSETENKVEDPKQKSKGTPGGEIYTTRSRAKKDGNNTTLQDSESTLTKENTAESSLLPEKKRQTRRKQILAEADNTLTENVSPIKSELKSTRSQAKNLTFSPAQKHSASKKSFETPKKVSISSARKQHNAIAKLAADTVTPESSPILVNLTPHRSNKTPKKSPMNIGSPKTHSQSPLRLSKTPRKLTINVESPATSDKSSVSISNHSPKDKNLLGVERSEPFVLLTDFKKTASPTTGIQVTDSPATFVTTVKLRLRKSGDCKSPPKITRRDSSLTVDEILDQVADTDLMMKSPSKRASVLVSKIRKSPIKTPAAIKTPKKTPINARLSNLLNPESPKRPKSTIKKRSSITSLGTPLRPISEGKIILENKAEASPASLAPKKIAMLIDLGNSSPNTTPRGRIRRSLNLTPDFIKLSTGSTSSPIASAKKVVPLPMSFPKAGESEQIIDQSIELVDGSNFMNVSDDVFKKDDGTYELSKDIENPDEVDDATYELDEPKTPSLKKQSRKRSLSNVEPGKCTPDAKKQCRVRFASPAGSKDLNSPSTSNRKSVPTVKTPAKQRVTTRLSRGSIGVDSARRRSRSLTKINEKNTSIKRRSISVSDLSDKTPKFAQSIRNSINRLSKPRQLMSSESKLEVKLPVARKIPNFAQIHQKKFEKMESLVDAKKRVAKRHVELNTMPSTRPSPSASTSLAPDAVVPEAFTLQASKKPAPVSASNGDQNGVFNRFGFKLRKAEAMKVVTKKPPAVTRSKNHLENNRSILKGVRTNRRFELQMKARNMKQ